MPEYLSGRTYGDGATYGDGLSYQQEPLPQPLPHTYTPLWQLLELREDPAWIDLRKVPGIHLQEVKLGWPETRRVVDPQPGQSGENDLTYFHGGRAVTITFALQGIDAGGAFGYGYLYDVLAQWLRPDRRPYLHFLRDGDQFERRMLLTPEGFDVDAWSQVDLDFPEVTMEFRAPLGVSESVVDEGVTVFPTVPVAGRTYPRNYSRTFPVGVIGSDVAAVNVGNTFTPMIARIHGPCVAPRLVNLSTGATLAFKPGFTLGSGDYVEIDTASRKVQLNGPDGPSRYRELLWPTTSWWLLSPGTQFLRFAPESYSQGAHVEVVWRSRWL